MEEERFPSIKELNNSIKIEALKNEIKGLNNILNKEKKLRRKAEDKLWTLRQWLIELLSDDFATIDHSND